MTQHFPDLPGPGELRRTDRICSSSLPCAGDRKGIERVFHEAGPVAFVGPGKADIRCVHCSREFDEFEQGVITVAQAMAGVGEQHGVDSICPENTDKTLTGAA